MDGQNPEPAVALGQSPGWFRRMFGDAVVFWERGRLIYNAALTTVVIIWLVASWPHFRPALTLSSLVKLFVLALLANACYCAAYVVEIPMRGQSPHAMWAKRRWIVWLMGTVFAIVFENYWIADEIYPFVH
jgi:hypothetical protein